MDGCRLVTNKVRKVQQDMDGCRLVTNKVRKAQQDMDGCRLVTNKVRKAQGIMKFKFVSVAKKLFLYFHHENLFRRIIFCH